MSTTTVILVSIFIAAAAAWGAWHIDQRIIRANSRRTSTFYAAMAGMSAWTISVVVLANLFQVPGYFGPVQYVPRDSTIGMTFFYLRVLTFGMMFLVPLVAGVAYSVTGEGAKTKSQRYLVPITSLLAYFAAWAVMMEYQFFPTV